MLRAKFLTSSSSKSRQVSVRGHLFHFLVATGELPDLHFAATNYNDGGIDCLSPKPSATVNMINVSSPNVSLHHLTVTLYHLHI